MLRHLLPAASSTSHRSGPRSCRLSLELLEDRMLLSTFYWLGGHGDLWTTAQNWSTTANPFKPPVLAAKAPNATDTLVFDGRSAAASAANLPQISTVSLGALYSGQLVILAPLTVTHELDLGGGTILVPFMPGVLPIIPTFGLLIGGGNKSTFNWSGGKITGTGLTEIGPNTTANIIGPLTKTLQDASIVIENGGTTIWQQGTISLSATALVVNQGLFSVTGNNVLSSSALVPRRRQFVNQGTFVKQGGVGITDMEAAFDNAKTVSVKTGTLYFGGGGTMTGSFDVAASAHVQFGPPQIAGAPFPLIPRTYTFRSQQAAVTGAGDVKVLGGARIDVPGGNIFTFARLELDADGVIEGTGLIVITDFTWAGGRMIDKGITQLMGKSSISNGTPVSLSGRSLINYGNVVRSGSSQILVSQGAEIVNDGGLVRGGGVFDMQSDASIVDTAGDAGPFWNQHNARLIKSKGVKATVQMELINQKGSKVAPKVVFEAKSVLNSGIITIGGGTLVALDSFEQSSGTTTLGGGQLVVGGPVVQDGGTISLENGELGGDTVETEPGAVLSGAGSILGDVVNAGELDPGGVGYAGTISIKSNPAIPSTSGLYAQAGTLNVDVGGTGPGTGFDQLNIAGRATLGGTLNVSLINGFKPTSTGQLSRLSPLRRRRGAFPP